MGILGPGQPNSKINLGGYGMLGTDASALLPSAPPGHIVPNQYRDVFYSNTSQVVQLFKYKIQTLQPDIQTCLLPSTSSSEDTLICFSIFLTYSLF